MWNTHIFFFIKALKEIQKNLQDAREKGKHYNGILRRVSWTPDVKVKCGSYSCVSTSKIRKFTLIFLYIKFKVKINSKMDSSGKISPSHPIQLPPYLH
jgi:hypothetical protein